MTNQLPTPLADTLYDDMRLPDETIKKRLKMTNQLPTRLADTLYDDMWLPDETIEVRRKVRSFADTVIRPMAYKLNNTPESLEAFPAELYKKMGDAGLLAIPFAEEYGGAGLEYPTLATMVLLEEIAYVSSGVAATLIGCPPGFIRQSLKKQQ